MKSGTRSGVSSPSPEEIPVNPTGIMTFSSKHFSPSSGNRLSSLRMFCSKVDRYGAAAGLRSGGVQRALPEVGFGRAHSVGVGRRFYGRTVRLCRVTESAVLELGRWKERGDFRKPIDASEENRALAKAIRLLGVRREDGQKPGNGKNFKQK